MLLVVECDLWQISEEKVRGPSGVHPSWVLIGQVGCVQEEDFFGIRKNGEKE